VLRPSLLAVFTEVRGIGILRTSHKAPAWCENSLGGGSIFMVSGWPGKGHGSLLKTPLHLFRVSFKDSKTPPLQCFGLDI
jgi:hypothetical protein